MKCEQFVLRNGSNFGASVSLGNKQRMDYNRVDYNKSMISLYWQNISHVKKQASNVTSKAFFKTLAEISLNKIP